MMVEFKRIKQVELDIYDLIKRYEKSGTKKDLVDELRKLDKKILKNMRGESDGNN